jgi:hypothetical protein
MKRGALRFASLFWKVSPFQRVGTCCLECGDRATEAPPLEKH